jgi:hypothetical protein
MVMNVEDLEGGCCDLFCGTIPIFACRNERETRRSSVRIADDENEIQTSYVPLPLHHSAVSNILKNAELILYMLSYKRRE